MFYSSSVVFIDDGSLGHQRLSPPPPQFTGQPRLDDVRRVGVQDPCPASWEKDIIDSENKLEELQICPEPRWKAVE